MCSCLPHNALPFISSCRNVWLSYITTYIKVAILPNFVCVQLLKGGMVAPVYYGVNEACMDACLKMCVCVCMTGVCVCACLCVCVCMTGVC